MTFRATMYAMVLPLLLTQAVPVPAHVGMDASITIPVVIVVAGAIAFGVRLEVRQYFLTKEFDDFKTKEFADFKKTTKETVAELAADVEAAEERVGKVEQEQAVQAVVLGRIEGGVERIEKRLDTVLTGRGHTPVPTRAG